MLEIHEGAEGRLGDSRRLQTTWHVRGAEDEADARLQLLSVIPVQIVQNIDGTPHEFDDADLMTRHRDGVYKFRVSYLTAAEKQLRNLEQEELPTGEWTFSFDTTGGVKRLTQSLGTTAFDNSGANTAAAAFFKNAINIRGMGAAASVEGADVFAPALRFQVQARFESSRITIAYAKLMRGLTATVNSTAFPPQGMPFVDDQFDAGEVLFLGANGRYSSSGAVDLTLHFDASPNVSGLSTGDVVSIEYDGHDFVWYWYEPTEEATMKRTVPQAQFAYVERVYERADLTQLFV